MPNQSEKSETPTPSDTKTLEKQVDKRLERDADEAAERALKTEQRYDKDHNIFTK